MWFGEAYGFVMRAAYLPYESPEQIERDTRRHRETLNRSRDWQAAMMLQRLWLVWLAMHIAVIANLYASNGQQNPYFKGGARGVVVNNLIDNPGSAAIHYGLQLGEWGLHPWVAGQIAIVGNALNHGPDTKARVAAVQHQRYALRGLLGGESGLRPGGKSRPLDIGCLHGEGLASRLAPRSAEPSRQRGEAVRPGQRRSTAVGRGRRRSPHHPAGPQRRRQDSGQQQEVGGYPSLPETHRAFEARQWDLSTMTSR